MGYSDLIDRLLDTRINEGMISSISKNKDRNADVGSLCSALLNGSLFRIPTKCIDIRDTYCIHDVFTKFDRGEIIGVDTRLLGDTVVVMETLFEDFAKVFKFNYKNDNYDFVVGEIAKACVNYEISFTEVGFVVTLDFGVAKERNRIEMILNNRKGGHSLRFLKDGKSKIKLSGGFI